MPRKNKGFKSRLRDAAKASSQGKTEEANKIWQEITVNRKKLKDEKAAKKAAKKTVKA